MGGRTHDYHCRNCHTWVNGFTVDDGATCGCGQWDGFYDLNNDGCEGGCPERVDCEAVLTIDQDKNHWVIVCFQSAGHTSPHTSAISWPTPLETPMSDLEAAARLVANAATYSAIATHELENGATMYLLLVDGPGEYHVISAAALTPGDTDGR